MTGERFRRRVARWLDPTLDEGPAAGGVVSVPVPPPPPPPLPAGAPAREVWPGICERFALRLLGHAEKVRPALDELESDEHDEERLRRLYEIDHSVTRMRRAARDLRILAGVEDGELDGCTSSLVDVIRAAESSIEHYPNVVIGRVVHLAVVPYASDDFSSLLAALLDNATGYSPSTVTVSAHLLDSGSVMLRIEDNGIGIPPTHLDVLNTTLAGPVPRVSDRTGRHTGFPVVHRLARKHGVGVRFASRPAAGRSGGTIAMVTIPPDLLCEVPEEGPAVGGAAEPGDTADPLAPGGSAYPNVARPPSRPGDDRRPPATGEEIGTVGGLPRRTRTSLRDAEGGRVRAGASGADASAGARSFAEDLSAFTAAEQTAARPDGADQDGGER